MKEEEKGERGGRGRVEEGGCAGSRCGRRRVDGRGSKIFDSHAKRLHGIACFVFTVLACVTVCSLQGGGGEEEVKEREEKRRRIEKRKERQGREEREMNKRWKEENL